MSKQLRIWLFVLLGTLLASSSLLAEGVITMTTSKAVGETIKLKVEASSNVTIEGAQKTGETNASGTPTYTISSQTITIQGDVTFLQCSNNQLTSLDVSKATALEFLDCFLNQLTSLNVSGCTALRVLTCYDNQLTSLNVSKNTALEFLYCFRNQLTNLNVSGCTALRKLTCYDNQLTSLNVSGCTALGWLLCSDNQLTSLDLSQNAALEELYCGNNQLTSLDVSQNTSLRQLYCYDNQLTSLDLSHNRKLRELSCCYNQIKGAEMTKLVNSLPRKKGEEPAKFGVVVKDPIEGNVCLKSDVAIVANKGWTPLGYDRLTEAWEYYGGRETESFAVTLTQEGEGKVNATGANNLKAVPYGTELTIEATPAEGYELTALTANGQDILATRKVVVTGATEIKATFVKKTFAVTLTHNEHGKITIAESVDLDAVPYGTTLTVKATGKNAQCVLTELTANGKDILATKSFVVTDVTEVKATFVDHTSVETTVTQQIQLYPNPATDYVMVEGVAPASEVTLHCMTGERLYAGRADSRGTLQIDLTPYADGVYLVCVAGETYRVVVRR